MFPHSSMAEALRCMSVSPLDVCLRHLRLVHSEGFAHRGSITPETPFLLGLTNIHLGEPSFLRGRDPSQIQRVYPLLVGVLVFNLTSMEGFMSRIRQSIAVLVLTLVGLVACAHEPRTVGEANPTRVADTKAVLRDLWAGHIFWIRNVVWDNASNNTAARDAAEKEVVANAKQIASSIAPFYGEAASEKLFNLLAGHYGAVKEYSDATIAGSTHQQDLALAHLASNAEDIAVFLSGANPYLPKDSVRGLIAAHGAHHVAQITQFQKKDYAHEGATWQVMRQHVYVIADALTAALVAQFPAKFS